MGRHIIRHYFVMRQYEEASELVLSFLQFLRSSASLPAKLAAEVDEAIKVRQCACTSEQAQTMISTKSH
jgi:hypothetical protein